MDQSGISNPNHHVLPITSRMAKSPPASLLHRLARSSTEVSFRTCGRDFFTHAIYRRHHFAREPSNALVGPEDGRPLLGCDGSSRDFEGRGNRRSGDQYSDRLLCIVLWQSNRSIGFVFRNEMGLSPLFASGGRPSTRIQRCVPFSRKSFIREAMASAGELTVTACGAPCFGTQHIHQFRTDAFFAVACRFAFQNLPELGCGMNSGGHAHVGLAKKAKTG